MAASPPLPRSRCWPPAAACWCWTLFFGALTGAPGALIGVGFLGALTFVAFVTACQAVTGLPGTGLAALVLVFAGNAVSGGTVPFAFLPAGFRQVAPWLPNGAIVSAARDVVYLPASDLAHPLLVLGIWLAASLAVLGRRGPAAPGRTPPHTGTARPTSTRHRARHTCGGGSPASGRRRPRP